MGRFEDALARPGLGAIAEIKRRSPSAGDLRPEADPAEIAPAYAAAGAAAISVLVDERFGGTWDDLRAARAATKAPLLAKGFFSTDEHLRTAKEAGADAALLLLRDLDDSQTAALMSEAAELGLDTLVEAHDAEELDRGIALGARVLGVNARDLSTFAIDRRAQLELVARIPADRIAIAESGIVTRAQGAAAELAGADAILVGSTLMRAPDPAAKLAELISRPLVKVCGLTREEDVAVAVEAGADLAGFVLVPESPRAASEVLDVPDGVLSVAVWVGEAGESGADLDQVHTVEEGKVRGREAAVLREGEEVARLLDLPWEGTDPSHWDEGRRSRRARRPGGPARAGQRARRDRRGAALGGRRLVLARVEPGDQGSRARCGDTWRRRGHDRDARDLRPLRRQVRAGDADPGARRARRSLAGGAHRPRLPRRRSSTSAAPIRAAPPRSRSRRASRPASGSTSSARTSTTREPTRSTTPSARSCSRAGSGRRGSSPRPAPASTASRPRPRARASGSSASSSWAPRTCAGRRPTSSGCICSAPRSSPSSSARGR